MTTLIATCGSGLARGGTALAVILSLAGCTSDYDNAFLVATSDAGVRHPIVVTAERPFLDLPLPKLAGGLDPEARFQVTRFVRQYKIGSEGRLQVSAPHAHKGSREVAHALDHIRLIAQRAGIPHGLIVVSSHAVPTPEVAAIRLSFHRLAAMPPECGDWSANIARDRQNVPYPNFGCASQRNLAAMIANPTDLVLSAEETPRSSEVRSFQWKKYTEPKANDTQTQTALPKTKQD